MFELMVLHKFLRTAVNALSQLGGSKRGRYIGASVVSATGGKNSGVTGSSSKYGDPDDGSLGMEVGWRT